MGLLTWDTFISLWPGLVVIFTVIGPAIIAVVLRSEQRQNTTRIEKLEHDNEQYAFDNSALRAVVVSLEAKIIAIEEKTLKQDRIFKLDIAHYRRKVAELSSALAKSREEVAELAAALLAMDPPLPPNIILLVQKIVETASKHSGVLTREEDMEI